MARKELKSELGWSTVDGDEGSVAGADVRVTGGGVRGRLLAPLLTSLPARTPEPVNPPGRSVIVGPCVGGSAPGASIRW